MVTEQEYTDIVILKFIKISKSYISDFISVKILHLWVYFLSLLSSDLVLPCQRAVFLWQSEETLNSVI